MDRSQESSVLFSLNGLMKLEEERVREEDDSRRRQAEADAAARAEAQRIAREAEERRRRAEEEQRKADERQKREDAARLLAMQHAEVEAARVAAERRAQMELIATQQEHERKLAEIGNDAEKRRLSRGLALGVGALVVTIGAMAGAWFGVLRPAMEERERARAAEARLHEEDARKTAALLETSREAARQAQEALDRTLRERDEEQRRPKPVDKPTAVSRPPVVAAAKPQGNCRPGQDPHDPLNPCLP